MSPQNLVSEAQKKSYKYGFPAFAKASAGGQVSSSKFQVSGLHRWVNLPEIRIFNSFAPQRSAGRGQGSTAFSSRRLSRVL
jgi:hypothetical protein